MTISLTLSCSQRKITENRLPLLVFQWLFERFNLSKGQKICQDRYSKKYDLFKQLHRIMISKTYKRLTYEYWLYIHRYCRGVGVCSIYTLYLYVSFCSFCSPCRCVCFFSFFSLALVVVYIHRLIRIKELCLRQSISRLSIVPYFILIL